MIIDTSAIMSVLLDEPTADAISEALTATSDVQLSAASLVELQAVISHRGDVQLSRRADAFLKVYDVEVVDFTAEHAQIARNAYRDFGRASGHPARLNFGDCFSYALAYATDKPLLYVGDDFSQTDIRSALPR
ncbi:MAG: type II toxin-antitoxin system VapC family toxin [Promicromonosporaceae bacterium]|nr:type II toxin-antitoxin system VapC family toxin [Promicromonosporaceae bacterium]